MKPDATVPATVLQIVHNLDVGGLERVVISLIHGLDPARYRPVLACLQDGGALLPEVRASGLRVYGLRKGSGFSPRVAANLAAIVRRDHAAIIHCHNHGSLTYGLLASLSSPAAKVVYTAHGVLSASRLRRTLLGRGRGLIDRVVAVSADVSAVALAKGGMPASRIETIINGIDVRRFGERGERSSVHAEFGIPAGATVFGIVARLTAVKDHDTLLAAFREVRAAQAGAHLVIIGGGEREAHVRARVRDLGLAEAVTMTGDRRDIPRLLGALDAFVLSSRSEGLSITLLEAMAASLPVIATRVGGNGEIVVDGETGRLVPAGDAGALARAMIGVARDRAGAAAMGTAGRMRVESHFSERVMVEKYTQLYDRLLRGSR